MNAHCTFPVIAHARNDYTDKFAVPRQPGLVPEVLTRIVFEPEYRSREALRGLADFSHLWLLWHFDRAVREGWSPTVRPPRLGGNARMGVFATRSPFRPSPIGLSAVKLLTVADDLSLLVAGADLADGTPILDIKPYLPYADCIPEAAGGFVQQMEDRRLAVSCPETLLERLPPESRAGLLAVLSRDPRPAYQRDPDRVYGFSFAGMDVRFTVAEDTLTVHEIVEAPT